MNNHDGFALICNSEGTVQKVIDNSAGMKSLEKGVLLISLFDPEYMERGFSFLDKVRTDEVAYGWKIPGSGDKEKELFHCYGIRTDRNMVILGIRPGPREKRYFDELMYMNNENINELRLLLKDRTRKSGGDSEELDLYDAISRLNNELSTKQRDLAKKSYELERINKRQNQMMGMVAHDLRNPLSVIYNFSTFLMEDQPAEHELNEQQREFLEEIRASSQLMLSIVEDMLDISAIESGNIRLNKSETDFCKLVRQVMRFYASKAEGKGIRLECKAPERPVVKQVDPNKMRQVLVNLISNAVKFSSSGSTVRISVRQEGKGVTISVEDEGQGIPKEELKNLFVPFAKISVTGTAGEKSTGLGLAITQKLVEAHGGSIDVKSKVGKGTTFTIDLP